MSTWLPLREQYFLNYSVFYMRMLSTVTTVLFGFILRLTRLVISWNFLLLLPVELGCVNWTLIICYCDLDFIVWNILQFDFSDMAHCLLCSSAIIEDAQYYMTCNIGPEITTVIEQTLGHEIAEDGLICAQCFENVQDIASRSPSNVGHDLHTMPPETNVCVYCRSSLFNRRCQMVGEGPQRQFISERISPRIVPNGSRVCYSCWRFIQDSLQAQGIMSTAPVNTNNCVWCKVSLARRRRHSLPEGPERDEIIQRIHPREIPPGGLVCYACWVKARRNVQRASSRTFDYIEELLEPGPSHSHYSDVCVWCGISLFRKHTHILTGREREEVAARIYPSEMPQHALVCSNCLARAKEIIQIEKGHIIEARPDNPSMTLDNFSLTTSSSGHCFVPGCHNVERHLVPDYLRKRILQTQKVFVTENSRICTEHKCFYNWEFLDEHQFSNTFNKLEMESMLRLSIKHIEFNFDFENFENIHDSLFKYWTGVEKEKYVQILNIISPAFGSRDKPKTSLGVYLIKVRTGDTHERISSLLGISKSSITTLLDKAREALKSLFVPLHLGTNHLSREELIGKNLIIPQGLFGDREEPKPIVICDGTYVYLQKSSNYMFQKKSYSLHKYRNLVKPFLMVATDGHIIDVFGPYPATVSDADIMKALFQNENEGLRTFFTENDIFILDRGFRDSISFLENLGFKVHQPESLAQGEKQLPTERANKSRFVTLCRWVVEVVNGRFKRDFKLFRQEFFNLAAPHLMDDFRICAALINAFHPVIVNRPDAEIILNRALERKNMPNVLGDSIITNRINRYRAQFTRIDSQLPELDIFPQMTMSDLIIFALGIYQIKQARSYYGEHIRQHGTFDVEISEELEVVTQLVPSSHETVLVRGRIKSRHQSGRIYYTYILLARQGMTWNEAIAGYYCSCVAGLRTVGCCAHVMTIVWYLGWARYQESIEAPASFLDGILVREDIENEE